MLCLEVFGYSDNIETKVALSQAFYKILLWNSADNVWIYRVVF